MSAIEAALEVSGLPQGAEVTQICFMEGEETLECCCDLWKPTLPWERGHS